MCTNHHKPLHLHDANDGIYESVVPDLGTIRLLLGGCFFEIGLPTWQENVSPQSEAERESGHFGLSRRGQGQASPWCTSHPLVKLQEVWTR